MRLLTNPSFYGLSSTEPEPLRAFLEQLVSSAINQLQISCCVSVTPPSSYSPLFLGHIVSKYYLNHLTARAFTEMLGPDTNEAEALRLLASCQEYAELPVRHNEDLLNEEMSKSMRFALGSGAWDSPHVKAELLLQAYMKRVQLPIVDYVTDTRSVMEQAIRIVAAMLDVASDCGWVKTVRVCISILQSLTQGCFWDDSPLLQLPHVQTDDALFSKLSHILNGGARFTSVLPWKSPQHASVAASVKSAVTQSMPPQQSNDILRCISMIPRMHVTAKWTADNSDDADAEASASAVTGSEANRVLTVLTNIENRAGIGFSAHAPRFPKVREEGWWLLVCSGDNLIASKRISSRSSMMTRLTMPASDADANDLVLHVMSDCYLGLDISLALSSSGAMR